MAFRKGRRAGVILFRGVLIAVIVCATAAISLVRGGWWDSGKAFETTFIYALAGAALLDQIIKLIKEYRFPPHHKIGEPVYDLLVPLLPLIVDTANIDWKRIGVHAFRVEGVGSWKCMRRIKRIRVYAHPGAVDIRWTKEKGPLGKCWESKEPEFLNFREKVAEITDAPTEPAFNDLDDTEKMGLSYGEYRKLIKNFAEVGAWPIPDAQGEIIGCIVVDIPHGGDPEGHSTKSLLNVDGVSQHVSAAVGPVGRVIKPQ
ncbi:hypothetical protein AB0D40_04240 [Streptomyces massasporeus]|uniref:hypothetical protein n=1 Tax=Streptomyces massasporeus TaxID=67324 RepID=UPI0033DA8F83